MAREFLFSRSGGILGGLIVRPGNGVYRSVADHHHALRATFTKVDLFRRGRLMLIVGGFLRHLVLRGGGRPQLLLLALSMSYTTDTVMAAQYSYFLTAAQILI